MGVPEPWIGELISCLLPVRGEAVDIGRALLLKDSKIPDNLYRYYKVSGESLATLGGDHVWLTSPERYNDPFDSAFTYSVHDVTRPLITRHFDTVMAKGIGQYLTADEVNSCRQEADPMAAAARLMIAKVPDWDADPVDFVRTIMNGLAGPEVLRWSRLLQQQTRICSFTPEADNALMWGHYADRHTGFCVEYPFGTVDRSHMQRKVLFPVAYTDSLFDATRFISEAIEKEIHASADDDSFPSVGDGIHMIVAAMTKSHHWSYEREWRYIMPPGIQHEGFWGVPKPSRVLLGARISAADAAKIGEIAGERGIPVQQMAVSHKEFRIIEAVRDPPRLTDDPAVTAMLKAEVARFRRHGPASDQGNP